MNCERCSEEATERVEATGAGLHVEGRFCHLHSTQVASDLVGKGWDDVRRLALDGRLCHACGGSGTQSGKTCWVCNGYGSIGCQGQQSDGS